MWVLRAVPQFLLGFWKWTQDFHIGFESAPWFDGCNLTPVHVLGSTPGLRTPTVSNLVD